MLSHLIFLMILWENRLCETKEFAHVKGQGKRKNRGASIELQECLVLKQLKKEERNKNLNSAS